MPKVNGKKFSYTPSGRKAAKKARRKSSGVKRARKIKRVGGDKSGRVRSNRAHVIDDERGKPPSYL